MPRPDPKDIPVAADNGGFRQVTDLHSLTQSLWQYGWIIVLCVVFASLGAAYYYKNVPRIYLATAILQVEQEVQRVVKIEQVVNEDLRGKEMLNTIAQKFCSRPLLERVVETNMLAKDPEFVVPVEGQIIDKEVLITKLEGMVQSSLRKDTRLVEVSVRHRNPKLAAKIANSLVEQYLNLDLDMLSASTKGAGAFLRDEADRLRKKLDASERVLNEYRMKVGSVSMQGAQGTGFPELQELSVRLASAKTDTLRLKAAYDQVLKAKSNVWQLLELPQITADSAVNEARTILAKAESDFELVRKRYKEKHPKYPQATSLLESARNSLSNAVVKASESLRVACENAQATEQGLAKSQHEAEVAALRICEQSIPFTFLAREVDSDRALFESVMNRLKETSLTTELQPEKIRVVQPATIPEIPVSPTFKGTFGLGILGGTLGGFVLVFFLNALNTSIKSVDDAESYLGLPVLATVLKLRSKGTNRRALALGEDTNSAGVEAFRTLRTSLSMLGQGAERRSFLFTSALPLEGKTFSSVNCAVSYAQQGLRTLLIDADLRRPKVAEYMAEGAQEDLPGVTDYLLGLKNMTEIFRPNKDFEKLSWIPAGKCVPNPAELLAQGKFKGLLDEALHHFDRIVVDSAPIHAVSDTLVLASTVQTTVFVIHGGRTPRAVVGRSVQLLEGAGASLGGVVLNQLSPRGAKGYYYYYHDAGYYSDGARNGKNKKDKKTLTQLGLRTKKD